MTSSNFQIVHRQRLFVSDINLTKVLSEDHRLLSRIIFCLPIQHRLIRNEKKFYHHHRYCKNEVKMLQFDHRTIGPVNKDPSNIKIIIHFGVLIFGKSNTQVTEFINFDLWLDDVQ